MVGKSDILVQRVLEVLSRDATKSGSGLKVQPEVEIRVDGNLNLEADDLF